MTLSKKSLKKIREITLEITPEITVIMKDITETGKGAGAESAGFDFIEEYVNVLLSKRYENILKILSAIYETESADLEEKTIEEIINMVVETLNDKVLLRFFPQLQPWVLKMQSGTQRK